MDEHQHGGSHDHGHGDDGHGYHLPEGRSPWGGRARYGPIDLDPCVFGSYASDEPPPYVPHTVDHGCFRPDPSDYRPPVTCLPYEDEQGLRVRIDQRLLSADQRTRFLAAYQQLIDVGILGPLVDIHANAVHNMHGRVGVGGNRFLPWHRVYLARLEALLATIDPAIAIPYWRWSEDPVFPVWLTGFTPTVPLASGPYTVTRNPGAAPFPLPDQARVTTILGTPDYASFTSDLEGAHNTVHVWVGGGMGAVPTAPADPVFWMHHCEIDRIWADWQGTHPGEAPSLAGADAVMDPWSETASDVATTEALGYRYA